MTVRLVKKEMNFEQGAPSNDAPQMAPQQPMNNQPMNDIQDHTHPEYDQMMVKIQELESALSGMQMGGVNQESLDEGKPENDKGKPTGNQQPIADNQGNWEPKKVESIVRKVMEELKGMPERDTGKDLEKSGPDNTQNIPQSTQPAVGDAPSGGGFDSDDKTNEEDGDDAENKVTKPASEYDKLPIKKNKLELAKNLIEKAKAIMKEDNGPDPSKPNPGKEEESPKKMDGSVPNKSPMGGTEAIEEDKEEDEDNEEDKMNLYEETVKTLKKELKQESKRETLIGMSAMSNESSKANQEEFVNNKQQVTNTIKEYLAKAGHNGALRLMAN